MMTVAELIEQLKRYPSDMTVVVDGYEGGYDNPVIEPGYVAFDTNWDGKNKNSWYMGRHDSSRQWDGPDPITNAVVIGR